MADAIASGSSPRIEEPALSFQVYSPGDSPPRPTSRSVSDAKIPAPGMSLGVRVCLFLVGLCVVVGTASAIVAVSTDDPAPKPATSTTPANPPPVLVSTGSLPLNDPNAPPVTAPAGSIVIDPPPPASGTPTPTVAAGAGAAVGVSGKKPIGGPPTTAPKSSAPPQVRGAAPPPNPYAGGGAKPAPAPPKKTNSLAGNPF